MNVLMLTPSFAPSVGGVETHVRRVCEELLAMGHQPVIVSRRASREWPAEERLGDLRVHRLPARPGFRALRSALGPLVEQAQVVHAHDAYPMLRWYLPVRWMLPRRPAFITFHGYEKYPIPREARVLRRIAGRAALGSICMGEFICKWYHHRCDAVSYGGVDEPAEVPEPRGDTAVFIGRLEPDTGIAEIIEALRLLREGGRSLPLTVCGDGSLRARLESEVRAAGIEAEFVGRVAEPRAYLLRARYAFVTGFLAILEAMACRRLVLSIYDTPIKRDYLTLFPARDAIVIAGSPGELAARLAEHLDAPSRSRELLDQAQAFAREQTWRKVAETYLRLYAAHGVIV